MGKYYDGDVEKRPRIQKLIDDLYDHMPEIEADRAVILTESYKETEDEPIILRRAKAFQAICEKLPITIRPGELIVGSNSRVARGCQVFPEYSFSWVEDEFDTFSTRTADPFHISEEAKQQLHEVYKYWKGKTTSDLATSFMTDETLLAMKHNIFTPGNYFYNGIGHFTVKYWEVLEIGYEGIMRKAEAELASHTVGEADYAERSAFLKAVIISCQAAIHYAGRYAVLAREEAAGCQDPVRKQELLAIAANCDRVPAKPAESFYEACQSFWFVQMLLQTESSGHSISPGRFDQYMYPYFKKDLDAGKITHEDAQELLDCIWVKLNDLNKVRDAASAEGFAGYSLFQNLIVGGQNEEGEDVTNDLSFMCIEAAMHVHLPAPSLSIRVWNGSPDELLLKAAKLTRTGIGLPAYYNDEVIIPAIMNRGVSLKDARGYNIIGCVEPQAPGKTDGWHDAAFFNMLRPLELVFTSGEDFGEQVGPKTMPVEEMTGRGAGLTSEGLVRKINAIKKAITLNKPDPEDAIDVLAKVGGLDIAGMAGVFLGGAVYGIPVVMDGFISCVSALIAMRICPAAKDYILASHVSKEPAAHLILENMGKEAIIHADMCLGEGTGAVALFPILDLAAAVYHSMSTFDDIHVEQYEELK